eukprot:5328238-Prymnesium_polylepis.1
MSHAGHNEAEAILYGLGQCKEGRTFMKTKQTIDESKGSKPRCWAKTLLDELTQYVSDRPELIAYIEKQEGKKAGSLGKPPGGVKERFGFYGKSAEWYSFGTGRVELIVQYALAKEHAREASDDDELAGIRKEDLTVAQRISLLKADGVRDMLLELASPQKRLALIIWEWHYTNSLGRWLNFTQNDSDPMYQTTRVHRVIRRRLQMMEALKGWTDTADGPWKSLLKPVLDSFISQHPNAFQGVDARQIARLFYSAAYDDFYTRTRGYMESP